MHIKGKTNATGNVHSKFIMEVTSGIFRIVREIVKGISILISNLFNNNMEDVFMHYY